MKTPAIVSAQEWEAARAELVSRGVEVLEAYHRTAEGMALGRDPEQQSYASLASFQDPDGNSWLLQEITVRLPGRMNGDTAFKPVTKVLSYHLLDPSLQREAAGSVGGKRGIRLSRQ